VRVLPAGTEPMSTGIEVFPRRGWVKLMLVSLPEELSALGHRQHDLLHDELQ
jgi:hypothetical protein